MPRIILHVGPHKTASTYIQTNLVAHRALLATHGVVFPSVGMTEMVQHCHLGLFHALHTNAFDQADRILTDILALDARVVILSAEDFVRMSDPAIAHLAGCEPKLWDQAAAFDDASGWLRLAGADGLSASAAQ